MDNNSTFCASPLHSCFRLLLSPIIKCLQFFPDITAGACQSWIPQGDGGARPYADPQCELPILHGGPAYSTPDRYSRHLLLHVSKSNLNSSHCCAVIVVVGLLFSITAYSSSLQYVLCTITSMQATRPPLTSTI